MFAKLFSICSFIMLRCHWDKWKCAWVINGPERFFFTLIQVAFSLERRCLLKSVQYLNFWLHIQTRAQLWQVIKDQAYLFSYISQNYQQWSATKGVKILIFKVVFQYQNLLNFFLAIIVFEQKFLSFFDSNDLQST